MSNDTSEGRQTNCAFSGQVSANPAMPDGQRVELQFGSGGCSSDAFSTIATATTTNGDGSFSTTFTAPSPAGTYSFRLLFWQTAIIDGKIWLGMNSCRVGINVNP